MGFSANRLGVLIPFIMLFGSAYASGEIPFIMAGYKPCADGGPCWNFSELAELGFDAYFSPADWTYELSNPGWHENMFGRESVEAAKYNITFIAGQYYQQCNWDYIDFNYSRAVNQ